MSYPLLSPHQLKCIDVSKTINITLYETNGSTEPTTLFDGMSGSNNLQTIVYLEGGEIHPLFKDVLIAYTINDLISEISYTKCVAVSQRKRIFGELLKEISAKASSVRDIIVSRGVRIDSSSSLSKEVLKLYAFRYVLLEKPLPVNNSASYLGHYLRNCSQEQNAWWRFKNNRKNKRDALARGAKENKIAGYCFLQDTIAYLTEKETHSLMRMVRDGRRMVRDGSFQCMPFDNTDFQGKKWSGILFRMPLGEGNPLIHSVMEEVFGIETVKFGGDMNCLFFNTKRRRDLALEWIKKPINDRK